MFTRAFSLIEMMIVLVIVSILIAVAYPNYQHHVLRAHRETAKAALLNAASRLEEYYLVNHTYASATLENAGIPAFTEENTYAIKLTHLSESDFLIEAMPQEKQTKDECGTLSINEVGQRNAANFGCW